MRRFAPQVCSQDHGLVGSESGDELELPQLLDASSDDESSDAAAPSTPACASPRRNHTSALVGFRGASVYSAVPFPTVQVLHVYKRESMLIVFRLARTQITEHTSLSVGAVETERNPN